MAQLVTMTVRVKGVGLARCVIRVAGLLAKLVRLVRPAKADAFLGGIAVLIPKLIRCKAI